MVLIYAAIATYLLSINFYCMLFVRSQKKLYNEGAPSKKNAKGKLLLASALGGAIAAYTTMLVVKYKLDDLLLMIALPVIAVINVYFAITVLRFAPTIITV